MDSTPVGGEPDPEQVPAGPQSFPPAGPNSLASMGQRFLARVVDGIVLLVPAVLLMSSYIDVDGDEIDFDPPRWVESLAFFVIPVLYETLLVAARGQTIGKVTTRIRVARVGDGRHPTWFQALIRILLPVAIFNLPIPFSDVLALVVYLLAFAHPLRQGLHDRAAATVVVRTR